MASKELIRKVAEANDIVSVIGSYVQLTRAGAEFRALSPFTTERTPSFYVMPSKQAFYCFSSQQGGDVFRFLQLYENLTFPEALKKLADRVGIRLDEEAITPEMAAKDRHRRRIRALQTAARDWFHLLLLRSQDAAPARDYLKGRGIDIEIAKRWKLGYAPANRRAFFQWARENKFGDQVLIDGGLAQPKKNGSGIYPHFQHRLMFPINNDYGETVAFSGRVLSPDQQGGKYVNSPETIIFEKSKMFFGLDRSKQPILKAGRAILCEGQLDFISAFEAGVTNMVAPLGTAFTDGQARLLARQTNEVLICFDADRAGQSATSKAFAKLAPAGISVRVVPMPTGEDPDSLIRKGGADAFRQVVDQAEDYFDFLIRIRGGASPTATIAQRVELASELARQAALVPDAILRGALLQNLSTRLGVPVDQLAAAVQKEVQVTRTRQAAKTQAKQPVETPGSHVMKTFCRLLLTSVSAREWVHKHAELATLNDIAEAGLARLLCAADIDPSTASSVSAFLAELSDEQQNAIGRLLVEPGPASEENLGPDREAQLAMACWIALRRKSLENRIAECQGRLARLSPDSPEIFDLLTLSLTLETQLRELPTISGLQNE
ncbi:MAG: DNA primase [Verrucomicrobia bacterium]|jgi:DNA primase|nr:MAG: DNA primase [Verrucomicrobiota bacterium]